MLLRLTFFLIVGVGCFAASTFGQRASFTVGTATAASGQRATGFLQVPAGVDTATDIPVIVVNGAKSGPVLALVSGAHGTEYASIIALEKLIPALDPAELSGTVVLLPLVNIPSFLQKVPHVNPIDKKSMNRYYPGKPDGTQTDRVSYLITKEVVDRCDYLIDYHGGDLDESLRPYAYWGPTGKAEQTACRRIWCWRSGSTTSSSGTSGPRIPPLRAIWTTPLRYMGSRRSSWRRATRGQPRLTTSRCW
jgi:uncharacterized protein